MSDASSNARTLIEHIFDAWKTENVPGYATSDAFEVFASDLALRSYGLSLEEISSGVVGGGQDGGLDSVYVFFDDLLLEEDSEVISDMSKASDFAQGKRLELWVTQVKKTPGFEESAVEKLEMSLSRLLNLAVPIDSLADLYNSDVLKRVNLFRLAWQKLVTRRPRISVNCLYISTGDKRNITPQLEVKVNSLRQSIRNSIPDNEQIAVSLLGATELVARYNEKPSYTLPMRYQESVTSGQSHIALVSLRDYYELIVDDAGRLRRHLFEWNVRDYEGNVTVNREIRASLQASEAPEFWWLNNGITIICSEATSAGKMYSLSDIQIVNGLQTSHCIADALTENPESAAADRMLVVRIIVTANSAIRDQVIRATNRQTAVTDAALRATDGIQRNIENYFLAKGWYYERRKNFYKNENRENAKIVGIPFLGAAVTAMGLSRADKARGKPSSLLKNDEDYNQVFNDRVDLQTYLWAAQMQRQIDAFIASADTTLPQRNNLRFHLSMLAVEQLNGGPVRKPEQLRRFAQDERFLEDASLNELFEDLKKWSAQWLKRTEHQSSTLERATKSQRFTDYLLTTASTQRRVRNAISGEK